MLSPLPSVRPSLHTFPLLRSTSTSCVALVHDFLLLHCCLMTEWVEQCTLALAW